MNSFNSNSCGILYKGLCPSTISVTESKNNLPIIVRVVVYHFLRHRPHPSFDSFVRIVLCQEFKAEHIHDYGH